MTSQAAIAPRDFGDAAPVKTSPRVSVFRLYLLRAGYLIIGIGMGSEVWPGLIHHTRPWELMHGVANAMFGALTLLCFLGVRYPLKMLPLIFFEMAWKAIWLLAIALPLWRAGQIDADTSETIFACSLAVIFPVIMPWRYVFATFVAGAGDRWR